jgi:hypothetical protein
MRYFANFIIYQACFLFLALNPFNARISSIEQNCSMACDLPNQEWMKIVDGFDGKRTLELATKLENAAKMDLEELKSNGNMSATTRFKFVSELNNIVNSSSKKEVEVSQEFYEEYRSKRDALCGILNLLDTKVVSKDTKRSAEALFLELVSDWGKIVQNEKKNKPLISFIINENAIIKFTISNRGNADLIISSLIVQYSGLFNAGGSKQAMHSFNSSVEIVPVTNLGNVKFDFKSNVPVEKRLIDAQADIRIKPKETVSFTFTYSALEELPNTKEDVFNKKAHIDDLSLIVKCQSSDKMVTSVVKLRE